MYQPSYFPPSYFAPLYFGTPATPTPAAAPGFRDRDAYDAIIAALRATGEFAEVAFATPIDRVSVGADRSPLAVLLPTGWAEVDDADSAALIRHVKFSLTLSVRGLDAAGRFQEIDRLSSLAQNAIDGASLVCCLRSLTRIRGARNDASPRRPEARVILDGQFSYVIDPVGGHDTSV